MSKRSISLRLSVTDACQLRCFYCRPENGEPCHEYGERLSTPELLTALRGLQRVVDIDKLRFTGGEPLLRQDLPELVSECAKLGIPDLALTTNGQRLADMAADLKRAGLNRVNVSLDSLDPDIFASVTRGGKLGSSLAGIQAALTCGLQPVKLNMVVMRGVNDHEIGQMMDFAVESGCQIRFLELMPIGIAADEFESRFISSTEVRERLAGDWEFQPLPYEAGGTSREYAARDSRGRYTVCGFVSPSSDPFCHGCKRLRLTADGRLMGCLARRQYVDIRPALADAIAGDNQPLETAIADALKLKGRCHDLASQREMARIGG